MSHLRYIPGQFGNFTAERYGLIGHDEAAVLTWLADHPDYRGSIGFDYADGSDEIDVTEKFFPEAEEWDAGTTKWFGDLHELSRGKAA